MKGPAHADIQTQFIAHLAAQDFPCLAAKAALARRQVHCLVAGHMACPNDDAAIVQFLYRFIADIRHSDSHFHSAAVIFRGPAMPDEATFDNLLWQRLQAIADIDAAHHPYDVRVDADPASSEFSFSIGEEGFYIIGLHPQSSRKARRFSYPALVFNSHAQFEALRAAGHYERMKHAVRERDLAYSGSVNPMLEDFGASSEALQYSGRCYEPGWECPLKIHHAHTTDYPAAQRHLAHPPERPAPEAGGR